MSQIAVAETRESRTGLALFTGAAALMAGYNIVFGYVPFYVLDLAIGVFALVRLLAEPGIVTAYFRIGIALVFVIALGVTLSISLVRGIYVDDYIYAYKSYLYMALLPVFVLGRRYDIDVARLVKILIMGMLAVYAVKKYGLGIERPTLITENNFELCALAILFLVGFEGQGVGNAQRYVWAVLLLGLVLISGSRSAVLCAAIAVLVAVRPRSTAEIFPMIAVAAALAFAILWVFAGRMEAGGWQTIDRYWFFQRFLYEIRDWTALNYIFGSVPLTQLTQESCYELMYYASRLSGNHGFACYSLAFGSFLARMVFDNGLLGVTLITIALFTYHKRAGYGVALSAGVYAIVMINGVSVSSLNSPVIEGALALTLAAGQRETRREGTTYANP